tara:strand:- start:485 stop:1819 length:1335 start_codon:yes stop_codon:yes gene_type:complete
MSFLNQISPIDGRYGKTTRDLSLFFSESALIKYRIKIEIHYFIELCKIIPSLRKIKKSDLSKIKSIYLKLSFNDIKKVKQIEKKINHDVKAVEYFIKEKFDKIGLSKHKEFVHFGLTSQDINNTATPLLFKDSLENIMFPLMENLILKLDYLAKQWGTIPMLARTHGQPASPTKLGKEIKVFSERLKTQFNFLKKIPNSGKFGGATGNLNAHYIAFPKTNWHTFSKRFLKSLGLSRSYPTTQIEHYDNLANQLDTIKRLNTILIDFNRDLWTYISIDYFKQVVNKKEVGSSAMPHKINPIDFENSEGNLGVANALLTHLSQKLPISRLQRDLTDSTVLRNLGIPISHSFIAYNSLLKGLNKLIVNEQKIKKDLNENWLIISEAIQTILRREGFKNPYELLKNLTRNNSYVGKDEIVIFINSLKIDSKTKEELLKISPNNYTGKS